MKAGDIGQEVRRLGAVPGVLSCALVVKSQEVVA